MKDSKNKNRNKFKNIAIGLIFPIAIILLWQFAYDTNKLPPCQASSPLLIIESFIRLVKETNFINNLLLSISRLFIGVIIGTLFGIVLGVVTSTTKIINKILAPTIQFFSGVPVVVWIPFWIMIFGIGESFKIGLVAISTFFLVYGNIYQSIISIDKEFLDLGRLYQKKYSEKIIYIYMPYSFYSIFGAIRMSLMIGWIVLFFVEYSISFEGKEGLGWFIANARGVGRVEEEFVGLISLGVIAFLCDTIVALFQKKSIEWKK